MTAEQDWKEYCQKQDLEKIEEEENKEAYEAWLAREPKKKRYHHLALDPMSKAFVEFQNRTPPFLSNLPNTFLSLLFFSFCPFFLLQAG